MGYAKLVTRRKLSWLTQRVTSLDGRVGRGNGLFIPKPSKDNARIRYQNKRRKISIQLKQLKGGKCEICGYSKNLYCLDFHHFFGEKKFNISEKTFMPIDKLLEEVSKCKLLCRNCHMDLHHPQ